MACKGGVGCGCQACGGGAKAGVEARRIGVIGGKVMQALAPGGMPLMQPFRPGAPLAVAQPARMAIGKGGGGGALTIEPAEVLAPVRPGPGGVVGRRDVVDALEPIAPGGMPVMRPLRPGEALREAEPNAKRGVVPPVGLDGMAAIQPVGGGVRARDFAPGVVAPARLAKKPVTAPWRAGAAPRRAREARPVVGEGRVIADVVREAIPGELRFAEQGAGLRRDSPYRFVALPAPELVVLMIAGIGERGNGEKNGAGSGAPSAERPRSWDEYTGKPPPPEVKGSASTSVGIEFGADYREQTVPMSPSGIYCVTFWLDLKCRAIWDPTESWVRDGAMTDEFFRHEQGHFDIAAACCEKWVKEHSGIPFGFSCCGSTLEEARKKCIQHMDEALSRLEKDTNDACYRDYHEPYDTDTDSGRNAERQAQWEELIRNGF